MTASLINGAVASADGLTKRYARAIEQIDERTGAGGET